MKVLLVSTYELGHQPLGAAGTAAAVAAAGHEVRAVDLAVEPWSDDAVRWADAIAFSVPMHTATELALEALDRAVATRCRPPVAWLGLYAPVLAGHPAVEDGDLLAAGETGAALLDWLGSARSARPAQVHGAVSIDLGPSRLGPAPRPARRLLPALDHYARYLDSAGAHLSASVEASRGCNHRCRHCPVAAVYGGRSRALPIESVRADLEQVVELGASHVTFADPDFLNRPQHAMAVARALHERHPAVTFDATVKVEHILRHVRVWPELAGLGLTFVVSAFESTDDGVLALLDKRHTADDELEAVRVLRRAGVELRPSWLPFTPWATVETIGSVLELSARADLVGSTDPVQYSIRLLLPRGSLLLEDPDPVLRAALDRGAALDRAAAVESGTLSWRHHDEALEELRTAMAGVVEGAEVSGRPGTEVFESLWSMCRDAGAPMAATPPPPDGDLRSACAAGDRPRLSESWFCCAEPTRAQLAAVSR